MFSDGYVLLCIFVRQTVLVMARIVVGEGLGVA